MAKFFYNRYNRDPVKVSSVADHCIGGIFVPFLLISRLFTAVSPPIFPLPTRSSFYESNVVEYIVNIFNGAYWDNPFEVDISRSSVVKSLIKTSCMAVADFIPNAHNSTMIEVGKLAGCTFMLQALTRFLDNREYLSEGKPEKKCDDITRVSLIFGYSLLHTVAQIGILLAVNNATKPILGASLNNINNIYDFVDAIISHTIYSTIAVPFLEQFETYQPHVKAVEGRGEEGQPSERS
jgi:hypothetical protein